MIKVHFKYILFWIFYSGCIVLQAQNIDSLKIALKNAKQDTVRLRTLVELGIQCNPSEILEFSIPALELADKLLKDKSILNKKNILEYKAFALNNIGNGHVNEGKIPEALESYNKSLKLYESINDKNGISVTLGNIGSIYGEQHDLKKAIEYLEKSLKVQEEIGDKKSIAYFLINIGFLSSQMGNDDKAFKNYESSIKLLNEIDDKEGLAMAYNNTGLLFQNKKDHSEALLYFKKSLEIRKIIQERYGMASSFNSMAIAYFELKNYRLSTIYSDSALIIAKQLRFPVIMAYTESARSKIDSATGKYKDAFEHYKQFIIFRDSTQNEKNRKASIKSQLKYEYEKKEAVIKEQQEKERAVSEEKNRFQKIVIWSTVIGFIFVVAFAVFIFRALNITKQQKHIIEEKQKEILDSIRYAKRIQTSLLPTEKYFIKHLHKSQNK